MSIHRKSDKNARKAKYQRQAFHTEANKRRHLAKMKALNPNYPARKEKAKKTQARVQKVLDVIEGKDGKE